MAREPVILNIYDLSTWNWWLYYLGLGGERWTGNQRPCTFPCT